MSQDEIRDFICQRATRDLPQLEVLECSPVNEEFFYLYLRDPFSQASLVLPIANQWAEECKLNCNPSVCSLARAFDQASKILDFRGVAAPDVS